MNKGAFSFLFFTNVGHLPALLRRFQAKFPDFLSWPLQNTKYY